MAGHACINLRLPTRGGLYASEFEKAGRSLNVRVEGQLTFNNIDLMYEAALLGFGLAYLAEDQVRDAIRDGRLVQALADWCQPFTGYHLYIPEPTPAFGLTVDALRYRGKLPETLDLRTAMSGLPAFKHRDYGWRSRTGLPRHPPLGES